LAFDQADCVNKLKDQLQSLVTNYEELGLRYDDATAQQCIDTYVSVLRVCGARDQYWPRPCWGIFTGALAPGASCRVDDQCAAAPYESASCTDGVCVVQPHSPRAASGEACSSTCSEISGVEVCAPDASSTDPACYTKDGLRCDASTNTCQPLSPLGGACTEFGAGVNDCQPDEYCSVGYSNVCVAQHDTGPCEAVDECNNGTYCDSAVMECAPTKPDGTPCWNGLECQIGVCANQALSPTEVNPACGLMIPVDAMMCSIDVGHGWL
jgi:hypothetical protein